MPAVAAPQSMSAWCSGIWDFGHRLNVDTGRPGTLQVHATITNPTAAVGLGFHISVYTLGGGGYVLNSYNAANALAKSFYYPGALASGVFYVYTGGNNWGPRVQIVNAMPARVSWENEAWTYFLTLYPEYNVPAPRPVFTSLSDFPAL